MTDTPPADSSSAGSSPLTAEGLDFLVREIHFLDLEARTLLRSTSQAFAAVLLVAALVASLTRDVSRDIALILLPVLLTFVAMYSLNVTNEVAAIAEQRDRLSAWANREIGAPIFITRRISDLRRGSLGTIALHALAVLIILGAMAGGLYNAQTHGGAILWIQVAVTVVCLAFLFVMMIELPIVRVGVNEALDEILGDGDRPDTAAHRSDGIVSVIRSGTFARADSGPKE